MKPKLKSEFVVVKFWDCGIHEHRHRTKAIATACIRKRERIVLEKITKPKFVWDGKALTLLLSQFRSGSRKVDLARNLGRSAAYIAQLIKRAERLERSGRLSDFVPYVAGRGKSHVSQHIK